MTIERDKKQHFSICFIIAAVSSVIIVLLGATLWPSVLAGIMVAMSAGVTKEWCDKLYGNKIDIHDLIADLSGALLGSMFGLFGLMN